MARGRGAWSLVSWRFRFAQDFHPFHGVNRQTFAKYYNRHRASGGDPVALLPAKRAPAGEPAEPSPSSSLVLAHRSKGDNRYAIFAILKPPCGARTPRPPPSSNAAGSIG